MNIHFFIEVALFFGKFVCAVAVELFDEVVFDLRELLHGHVDFELGHLEVVGTGKLDFTFRHSA